MNIDPEKEKKNVQSNQPKARVKVAIRVRPMVPRELANN
jgi:hypothetical protein